MKCVRTEVATNTELSASKKVQYRAEITKRYSFSMACLAFAFIGIELGLFPTFYQFVETVLDVRIDLRLGVRLGARGSGVTGRPIGPAYQASYGYQAAVASSLRARIVPVPPPPQAEQLLQSARAAADPAEPGDGTPER